MVNTVFIGLGSNLGNRYYNIKDAILKLSEKSTIREISNIEETLPVGYEDQPKFLNCVVKVETDLEVRDLFNYVKTIEKNMGRQETFLNGPRMIDLDILFYNSLINDEDDLKVPHPRIADRYFVVRSMAELSPDHRHPILNKTMEELYKGFEI